MIRIFSTAGFASSFFSSQEQQSKKERTNRKLQNSAESEADHSQPSTTNIECITKLAQKKELNSQEICSGEAPFIQQFG